MTSVYDKSSIKVLEDIEHLRLRPGMYIGSQDSEGIRQILKEILDNSVDEWLAGHASEVEVEINTSEHTFRVLDNGRGIPVGKHEKTGCSTLITVFTNLNAGGKFEKQAYATSAGLHGVGLKATNALSSWLLARVWRRGICYEQRFERGEPSSKRPAKNKSLNKRGRTGTEVTFCPDTEIFGEHRIVVPDVRRWLEETSHLCPGLKVTLIVDGETAVLESSGLDSLVSSHAGNSKRIHDPVSFVSDDRSVSVSLMWTEGEGDNWFSACNASSTHEGGKHVDGAMKAIEDTLRPYAKKKKIDKNDLVDGMFAAIQVLVGEPQFKSQTKDRLLNSEVKDEVYSFVYPRIKAYFDSNKKLADTIVSRALQLKKARDSYKKLRQAVNKTTVKKNSRGILPGKLVEAMHCSPDERELFLVEGDSAGGSAKSARDPDYQEVLPLRGKIPNSAQKSLSQLLGNEEIGSIIKATGAQILPKEKDVDLSNLRIGKLLLLMDADPDGQHITSLALTFLSMWMPSLVKLGIVYVVDSPLFVGSYKDKRWYAHSIKGLESQSGYTSSKLQISRLKGHGECLGGSSLISTTTGVCPISSLSSGSEGFSSPVIEIRVPSRYSSSDNVDLCFHKKEADLFTVTTSYGYNLTSTIDHEMLTLSDGILKWKTVGNLVTGDYIALDRRIPHGDHEVTLGRLVLPKRNSSSSLPEEVSCQICGESVRDLRSHVYFKHDTSWAAYASTYAGTGMFSRYSGASSGPDIFDTPSRVTPELARVLGYLIGDGSVTTHSFTIGHGMDEESAVDSALCLQSSFPGLRTFVTSDLTAAGETCWATKFSSVFVSKFFWDICGLPRTTSHHKYVPSCIMKAPNSLVSEFLMGYFESAGWSETHNSPKVGFYTTSEKLSDDLRVLLLRFGVVCKGSYKTLQRKGGFADEDTEGAKIYLEGNNVDSFFYRIGFVSARKRGGGAPRTPRKTNVDTIPGFNDSVLSVSDNRRLGRKGSSRYRVTDGSVRKLSFCCYTPAKELTYQYLDVGDNYSNLMESLVLLSPARGESLEWLFHNRPFWDIVSSVESSGSGPVYDLSVSGGESYTANGFMVHNCSAEELRHYAMNPETRKLWKVSIGDDDQDVILSLMGADSSSRKALLGLSE